MNDFNQRMIKKIIHLCLKKKILQEKKLRKNEANVFVLGLK